MIRGGAMKSESPLWSSTTCSMAGHNPAEFPVVGPVGSLASEHVELVEHQHPRPDFEEVEYLFEVPCRLAPSTTRPPWPTAPWRWAVQAARRPPRRWPTCRSRAGPPAGGSTWARRRAPATPNVDGTPPHQRVEDLGDGRVAGQHEVLERQASAPQSDIRGRVVAGLGKWPQRRHLQRSAPASRLIEDRFELFGHKVVALAPLVVDEVLGGRAGTRPRRPADGCGSRAFT